MKHKNHFYPQDILEVPVVAASKLGLVNFHASINKCDYISFNVVMHSSCAFEKKIWMYLVYYVLRLSLYVFAPFCANSNFLLFMHPGSVRGSESIRGGTQRKPQEVEFLW